MTVRLVWLIILAIASRLITFVVVQTPPEVLPDLGGFLIVVKNYNAAFSLNWPIWIFWPLVIVVIGYIIWQAFGLWQKKDPEFFFWGLISVGAINNLVDRLHYGAVIDYIRIGWWPVFNLADSVIVVGVLLLVRRQVFKQKKI